jgi:CobQ-like glutamine amidotransferase family enzyme
VALKADALRAAAARGALVLGICGGYQLLGSSYEIGPGDELEGVALVDVRTVRTGGPRLIGNVAIEVELDGPDGARRLAGFENHAGRTRLGGDELPLGRVIAGHGNDGRSGHEGVRRGNVIGTYLHGPLLPKNAWFADWLIATALGKESSELAPLDDELEREAHQSALRAAGLRAPAR